MHHQYIQQILQNQSLLYISRHSIQVFRFIPASVHLRGRCGRDTRIKRGAGKGCLRFERRMFVAYGRRSRLNSRITNKMLTCNKITRSLARFVIKIVSVLFVSILRRNGIGNLQQVSRFPQHNAWTRICHLREPLRGMYEILPPDGHCVLQCAL
jgi:hypothetical protein